MITQLEVQVTLADVTVKWHETEKNGVEIATVLNNLVKDLKAIKKPQKELIDIFEKYKIPYEKDQK